MLILTIFFRISGITSIDIALEANSSVDAVSLRFSRSGAKHTWGAAAGADGQTSKFSAGVYSGGEMGVHS